MIPDRPGRPPVPKRPFGATGLHVGEIGLGAWQIGTGWGNVGDADALGVVHAARAAGIDFIDTADVYGDGRSELLIAQVLAEGGWTPFVATKIGRWRDPGWPGNFDRKTFRAQAEASRNRLGVSRLDLLQLHTLPFEILRRGEVFDWLRELQNEGKIRHFGASVESVDEALYCLDQPGLASLQVIFSVLRQKPAEALFAAARQRGLALIARTPLASGLLAGKIKATTTFAGSDHRNFNRDGQHFNPGETFAGLPQDVGVRLSRELRAYRQKGATLAQTALRFILDFPDISVVIPGARRAAQVTENVAASSLAPLANKAHDELAAFYRDMVEPRIRGKN